jgi:hypothetical protein
MQKIKNTKRNWLLYCATIVLGIDYTTSLIFKDTGVLSLNRVLFVVIFLIDFFLHQHQYLVSKLMLLVIYLILFANLPFLFSDDGSVNHLFSLLGIFTYLLFFYVNCKSPEISRIISQILFLSSCIVATYVLGNHLNLFGEQIIAWKGNVSYLRAKGLLDPNTTVLYFLPAFSYGPLLFTYYTNSSRSITKYILLFSCGFCFFCALMLNSRAGTMAILFSLFASLYFQYSLLKSKRLFLINAAVFSVMVVVLIGVFQFYYGIFDTILFLYRETQIFDDTSFSLRLISYDYIMNELLNSPKLFGAGYSEYWDITRMYGSFPHCTFVDLYIKGGLIYLATYISLLFYCISKGLKLFHCTESESLKYQIAGHLSFLFGFFPLAITLSIDGMKMPWAIIGCIAGLIGKRCYNLSARHESIGSVNYFV